MADPILRQRAVLEVLERKIDALGAVNEFKDGITIPLYFWEDLVKNYDDIFRSATPEDVLSAITNLEKESDGRFKLVAIKPSTASDRNTPGANIGIMKESGRPLDVTNMYWEIKYSEKPVTEDLKITSKVFWLTPRDLHSDVSGKRCSFGFKPKGVQYRFLEWFSENKEFIETELLAKNLGTTKRTLGTEVADLRKKAEETFGLDEENFIESSQGEGYRVNKKIKIKKE